MQIGKPNPFLKYANNVNFDNPSGELIEIVVENILAIYENAQLQINLQKEAFQTSSIATLSFNAKTLKFISGSPISQLASSVVYSILNIFRPQDPIDDNPKNIKDFFDFLTSYGVELAHLEIGPEKEPFSIYLLRNYDNLYKGLSFLGESYASKNRYSEEFLMEDVRRALDRLCACQTLIAGISKKKFIECTREALPIDEAFEALKLKKFFPLKRLMEIGKTSFVPSWLDRKLKNNRLEFYAACLRMKKNELQLFCSKFEEIISRKSTIDSQCKISDVVFCELLHDLRFANLHNWLLSKLVRPKKIHETQEQFDARAESGPVKKALQYIQIKIFEFKLNSATKDEINSFLRQYPSKRLECYKPFQSIFHFISHHYDSPMPRGASCLLSSLTHHSVTKFVVNILLCTDNFNNIDIQKRNDRLILLKNAEPLFSELSLFFSNNVIKKEKLQDWNNMFPEFIEFPAIHAAIAEQTNFEATIPPS